MAIGSGLYSVAIVLYLLLYGQPDAADAYGEPSLVDRVAHLEKYWAVAQTIWSIEFAGVLVMAFAGLVLRDRRVSSLNADRLAWPALTVGCLVTLTMYPIMLAGYPEAIRVFATEPAIMAILNKIATFIFQAGNLVIFVGLAGAFIVSGQSKTISASIASAGTVLAFVGAVAALGMILGVQALQMFAPAGVLSVMLTAYLGFAIFRFDGRHL